MLILHGDNTAQSRKALQMELDKARQVHIDIIRLEAKKLTGAQLEETLGSSSLFGSDKLIVIEELHSLPTSERKKELIIKLANAPADLHLILWEKRALTKTMLKPFIGAKEQEYALSKTMFTWLDLIGDSDKKKTLKAFHTTLLHEDEQFCFIMFIRQIRLLIQAKDNTPIAGAPFMITKLKKQASLCTMPKLLQIHTKLLEIDRLQKTSKLRNSLAAELDLIQLGL